MTDTTTMNGAQFRREVGTDPEKWAEALLDAAYYGADVPAAPWKHPWRPEQIALFAHWLRDYAEVCVAEAVGRETAAVGRLVPRVP